MRSLFIVLVLAAGVVATPALAGERDNTYQTTVRQVASLDLLTKLGPTQRMDRDLVYVEDEQAAYAYDVDSSATADGMTIVAPESGTGRWMRVAARIAGVEEAVEAATVTNPTGLGTPVKGQRWLIAGSGGGGWASQDNKIAEYVSGTKTTASSWRYVTPVVGAVVASKATGSLYQKQAAGTWAAIGGAAVLGGAPPAVAASSAAGTATTLSRSDHTHGHADQGATAASLHDGDQVDFELADGSKKQIQAGSDTAEAALRDLDGAFGAAVSTLTTTAKTLVGAIDELVLAVGTAQATADAAIPKSTITQAYEVLVGSGAGTVGPLLLGASTILGRGPAGAVVALTMGTGLTLSDTQLGLVVAVVTNGGVGNAGLPLALDGDGKLAGRIIETDGSNLDTVKGEVDGAVSASAGAGDAGKLCELDGGGKLGATMLPTIDATIHGDLSGTVTTLHAAQAVSVADALGLITATETEGALQEAFARIAPVSGRLYIGGRTIAQIDLLAPAAGWVVVADDAGTPAAAGSDLLAIGDIAEYDGTAWQKTKSNVGGFVPGGTRLLVSHGTLYAPLTDVTDRNKVATFDGTSNTPVLVSTEMGELRIIKETSSISAGQLFRRSTGGAGWLPVTVNAANVPIADAGTYYGTDEVESALQSLGPFSGLTVVATSAGAGDAGKLASLDGTGRFDASFIPPMGDITFATLTVGHADLTDADTEQTISFAGALPANAEALFAVFDLAAVFDDDGAGTGVSAVTVVVADGGTTFVASEGIGFGISLGRFKDAAPAASTSALTPAATFTSVGGNLDTLNTGSATFRVAYVVTN